MTESKSKAPLPVLIQPGPRNSLADVVGLFVGNAVDLNALTGVTVVLPDRPLLAAVDVRGGIPGTYHTDALGSGGLMRHISALVLTGGAAYGIDAVAGLTSWLGARGRGFAGWGAVIPLVCGAVIFDLTNGGNKLWGEVAIPGPGGRGGRVGGGGLRAWQRRCRPWRNCRDAQGRPRYRLGI